MAWMAATSTLQAELQLVLPVWVRARGVAIYAIAFAGSQAAGSVIWGLVANQVGLEAAVLIAAVLVLAAVVAGIVSRLPETGHLDPQPASNYWTEPQLVFEPDPNAGPVMVQVEFVVPPDRQAAFLEAMEGLRGSRLRTGATRWELYRHAEQPNRFVEIFSVPSWEEHMRQHHGGRLTGMDREIEEAALAFSDPPPRGEHFLPP
jgi:quinol monooxygenase YgiN